MTSTDAALRRHPRHHAVPGGGILIEGMSASAPVRPHATLRRATVNDWSGIGIRRIREE